MSASPARSDSYARCIPSFFFFNDTATTEIYTLSLHDALPIYRARCPGCCRCRCRDRSAPRPRPPGSRGRGAERSLQDRKSTRLNSSHSQISYAVFCLKKKKKVHVGQAIPTQYKYSVTSVSRSE